MLPDNGNGNGNETEKRREVNSIKRKERKELALMVKTRQVNCASSCRQSCCCCQIESGQKTTGNKPRRFR